MSERLVIELTVEMSSIYPTATGWISVADLSRRALESARRVTLHLPPRPPMPAPDGQVTVAFSRDEDSLNLFPRAVTSLRLLGIAVRGASAIPQVLGPPTGEGVRKMAKATKKAAPKKGAVKKGGKK